MRKPQLEIGVTVTPNSDEIPVIVPMLKRPPSGELIGVVIDMRPGIGAIPWPPPPDDREPNAA